MFLCDAAAGSTLVEIDLAGNEKSRHVLTDNPCRVARVPSRWIATCVITTWVSCSSSTAPAAARHKQAFTPPSPVLDILGFVHDHDAFKAVGGGREDDGTPILTVYDSASLEFCGRRRSPRL